MATTTETEIEALFERYIEEFWNEGNTEVLDEICSPDFVLHTGDEDLDREEVKGIPETRNDDDDGMLSEFRVETEDVVVGDDTVAARVTLSGVNDRDLEYVEDYEPTGERIEYRGMGFMRVEDGVFVEEWQMVDRFDLLTEAGVLEPPWDEE